MDIFNVFTLLGGLAVFLFGMDLMGKALEKQAGNRLQTILAKMTDNPLKGFLLGLSVTAVIQSSSATTVMVVGFVNSGLMQLHQAVGVIMGSNVGTTVTAWILSLSGVEGDGFWVKLLNPTGFSPLLALVGIILYLFVRSERLKGIGTILLGFALLMMGMNTMSDAMAPLADMPGFQALFTKFEMPLLGLVFGAGLTAVIQSSSASVGILQALSLTGGITCGSALPIILGQNIGTCVTALISAVGANKSARRAAFVHLYFNIIGALLFMAVFYSLNALVHFSFLSAPVTPLTIAIIHTCFNVLATAVLLPFARGLEKLAYLTIPDRENPGKTELLDERLLATPAIAVRNSSQQACNMAELVRSNLLQAMSLVHQWDGRRAESVGVNEDIIDSYEDKIGAYLVKLSEKDLTAEDNRAVAMLLHTISDFERIGDHACNIYDSAREIHDKRLHLSDTAWREIAVLESVIQDIVDKTLRAFETQDMEQARKIEPLEQVVDDLVRSMRDRHIRRLQQGVCGIEAGFVLQDMLVNYERIADHCSNVAGDIVAVAEDRYNTHAYTADEKFDERYEQYGRRYVLPEAEEGQVD